jgi:hypothetical protein
MNKPIIKSKPEPLPELEPIEYKGDKTGYFLILGMLFLLIFPMMLQPIKWDYVPSELKDNSTECKVSTENGITIRDCR